MGYDRYPRGNDQPRDTYGRRDTEGRDRDDAYRSYGTDRDDGREGRSDDDGSRRYGQREQTNRGLDYGRGGADRGRESFGGGSDYYGGDRGYARDTYRQGGASQGGYGRTGHDDRYGAGARDRDDHGSGRYGRDSYASGGFGDRHPNDRGYSQRSQGERAYGERDAGRGYGDGSARSRDGGREGARGQERAPDGYQYEDRGFLARAGDEVRSWFGDDEAERRRDQDARLDERYNNDRDADYGNWRRGQIDALDRDYHEYRQENRSRFENEFTSWRTGRQGQRDSLSQVKEHMEVVGSDGSHVGTVDKVRGDRIILTKTDKDAGGHHHSIPSRWLSQVDDKVTLSKSADEAKKAWRDEEEQAGFGAGDRPRSGSYGQSNIAGGYGADQSGSYGAGASSSSASASSSTATTGTSSAGTSTSASDADGRTDLNKSFSGTY